MFPGQTWAVEGGVGDTGVGRGGGVSAGDSGGVSVGAGEGPSVGDTSSGVHRSDAGVGEAQMGEGDATAGVGATGHEEGEVRRGVGEPGLEVGMTTLGVGDVWLGVEESTSGEGLEGCPVPSPTGVPGTWLGSSSASGVADGAAVPPVSIPSSSPATLLSSSPATLLSSSPTPGSHPDWQPNTIKHIHSVHIRTQLPILLAPRLASRPGQSHSRCWNCTPLEPSDSTSQGSFFRRQILINYDFFAANCENAVTISQTTAK